MLFLKSTLRSDQSQLNKTAVYKLHEAIREEKKF